MGVRQRFMAVLAVVVVAGALFGAKASAGALFIANEQGSSSIAKGKTVDGSAYVAGNVVNIAGTVKGDVFCAGNSIVVEGVVEGDVLCAGNSVTVNGVVKGDVRVAGATVRLGGTIGGNATVAGADVATNSSLKLAGDLTGGASNLTLNGAIGRDVTAGASTLHLNGTVGRDVKSSFETVKFDSAAKVGGNFAYTSANKAPVPAKLVGGTVDFTQQESSSNVDAGRAAAIWGVGIVIAIAVFALLGTLFMPQQTHAAGSISWGKFAIALTSGLVFVVLAPIAAIMLLVTGVGAAAAYALVLVWLLLMAISPVAFAYFVGNKIYGSNSSNIIVRGLAGSLVLLIGLLVPVINVSVFILMLFAGVGMVLLRIPSLYKGAPYQAAAEQQVPAKAKKSDK